MEVFLQIIKSSVSIMIPIFFAALGGLFPAVAGTLNIALEGLLFAGAFSSLTVYYFTENAAAAVFAAVISSFFLCALHVLAVFKLRANVFISGIAVNLLSAGICIALSEKIFKTRGVVTANNLPGLINIYLIIGVILLVFSWLAIYKTPFGYRLRACDNNIASLVSLGINPEKYQITAIFISGFFAGLGGTYLSLNLGAFVPGMSAGKGWVALAVIFLGMRKPHGILAASFIFAFSESFSNFAQGLWKTPADFFLAFPYMCTLIAMIIISFSDRRKI